MKKPVGMHFTEFIMYDLYISTRKNKEKSHVQTLNTNTRKKSRQTLMRNFTLSKEFLGGDAAQFSDVGSVACQRCSAARRSSADKGHASRYCQEGATELTSTISPSRISNHH